MKYWQTSTTLRPTLNGQMTYSLVTKRYAELLAETTETEMGLAVIVGTGINLNSGNFPAELSDSATSIEQEWNKTPDPEKLLLNSFTSFFSFFLRHFSRRKRNRDNTPRVGKTLELFKRKRGSGET